MRRALLCGINDFQSVTDLHGCVNDTQNMERLLVEGFGYAQQNVHVLRDSDVQKPALRDKWLWLLSGARPGDALVFAISTHGSQIADQSGDEEDAADELICLWDMDFDRPETYLLDDEFREMIAQVPAGVRLSIVTDCCHAATNTRALAVAHPDKRLPQEARFIERDSPKGKDRAAAAAAATAAGTAEPELVQVRYLPPPPRLRPSPRAHRTLRQRRDTIDLPYLHLAACRDDETAADAVIDGAYNGAFTYALCAALRADPRLDSDGLAKEVARRLRADRFPQQPSFNGRAQAAPIFGDADGADNTSPDTAASDRTKPARQDGSHAANGAAHAGQANPGHADAGAATGDDGLAAAFRDLAAAQRELAAAQHIMARNQERLLAAVPADIERAGVRNRAVDEPVLVYVHGISQHRPGFSDPWWAALKDHVPGVFGDGNLGDRRLEVVWSDLVNPRELRAIRNLPAEAEMAAARKVIEATITERQVRDADPAATVAPGGSRDVPAVGPRGDDGLALDDFMRYMFSRETRSLILDRFYGVIRNQVGGRPIHLISHSWGTVVAYEALMTPEPGFVPEVHNFFTVGAALSIPFVRFKLGLRNARPDRVKFWWNLDAKGDGVGGGLAKSFPVDEDYVDLDPTGCTPGWFGIYNLGCAHGSYFRTENLAVNRGIFAKHILNDSPRAMGGRVGGRFVPHSTGGDGFALLR